MQEIEAILSAHGLSKRDFILAAAHEFASRRTPESQGGVKIVVDGKTIPIEIEDIEAAVEAVEREADQQHRIATSFTDRDTRSRILKQAGKYHNASMLLHQIIQAVARRKDGRVIHRSRGHQLTHSAAPPDILASLSSASGVR